MNFSSTTLLTETNMQIYVQMKWRVGPELKQVAGSQLLFYVKNANTTHILLSITVRGIHIWNGLASDITQLPSLQQFKKQIKVGVTFFVFMNS